jgi:hypothetical protein
MALTWVDVRTESTPIDPPALLPIAAWIRAAVAPDLEDEVSVPWHLAQLASYSVAPSVTVVGTGAGADVAVRAVAMALT